MAKDYYQLLGVSEKATADEIKTAYRKLARKYHPDVTGGDKVKEALFKDIGQAYSTLSDPAKRAEYDMQKQGAPHRPRAGTRTNTGFAGFGGFGGFGAEPRTHQSYNEYFTGRSAFDEFDFGTSYRGADIRTEITIPFAEAALGVEKSIVLEPDKGDRRRITIRIPAGVEEGETIRVPGRGRPPTVRGQGEAGDLYLTIHVAPHATLRREGVNLETEVSVSVAQAVLGTKVDVETLEGRIELTIPPGTSSGQKLRLKGKGAGDRHGGHGDLFVMVQVTIPKHISAEARRALEEFDRLTR